MVVTLINSRNLAYDWDNNNIFYCASPQNLFQSLTVGPSREYPQIDFLCRWCSVSCLIPPVWPRAMLRDPQRSWNEKCSQWPFMVLYGLVLFHMVFHGNVSPFYGNISIWTCMFISRSHTVHLNSFGLTLNIPWFFSMYVPFYKDIVALLLKGCVKFIFLSI